MTPKKETALMAEALSGITRRQIITAISIFCMCLFITTLYLRQRIEWNKRIEDSLDLVTTYKARYLLVHKQDSLKNLYFKKHTFDPSNESGKQLYGFLEDKERSYAVSDLAFQFNVTQPKSIKIAENGFIVPIKAVHFVQKNETAGSIAKIYYKKVQDSVLIKAFNKSIQAQEPIFIPFD